MKLFLCLIIIFLPISLGLFLGRGSNGGGRAIASNSISNRITCPDNQPAAETCDGPLQCPHESEYCFENQGCCRIPICSNGQLGLQPCNSKKPCPSSQSCFKGACCPTENLDRPQIGNPSAIQSNIICPDNRSASGTCDGPLQCPRENEFCFEDKGCCRVPVCPNGQFATEPCNSKGTPCPSSQFCFQGGCCLIE